MLVSKWFWKLFTYTLSTAEMLDWIVFTNLYGTQLNNVLKDKTLV
jgi:hypothetical protein